MPGRARARSCLSGSGVGGSRVLEQAQPAGQDVLKPPGGKCGVPGLCSSDLGLIPRFRSSRNDASCGPDDHRDEGWPNARLSPPDCCARLRSLSLPSTLNSKCRACPALGFSPAQWLSVKGSTPEGEPITRAYSIASAPSENARFAFCLNRVQDGFMSNYLCDLGEGSEISLQGPFGDFILRTPLRDTLIISTGTGIAPFRSMLHGLFEPGRAGAPAAARPHHFWLLFGARCEATIYYRKEFERLASEHSIFHFLPTLSRGGPEWAGARRIRAGACARGRGRPYRHAGLHLRA
jgi:NAD(P)H-flavin reductase